MPIPKLQPCLDPACDVHVGGTAPKIHCARQILRAYDRPGAIALLEQPSAKFTELGEKRTLLPLSAGVRILPGQQCQINAWANKGDPKCRIRSFHPDSLIFGTNNVPGPENWIVNDLVMDGRSQLSPHRDLPGLFFNAPGSMRVFDRISGGARVELTLTYVGEKSLGDTPYACLCGVITFKRREVKLGGGHLRAGEVRELTVRAEHAVEVFRVSILGPADRIVVSDIRYGGVSQFSVPGDIPGQLCESLALASSRPIKAGEEVTIVIKCVRGVDSEPIECALLGQEPETPEEDGWDRLVDAVIQGIASSQHNKADWALNVTMESFKQGPTERAELKRRVVTRLGHDPFKDLA